MSEENVDSISQLIEESLWDSGLCDVEDVENGVLILQTYSGKTFRVTITEEIV